MLTYGFVPFTIMLVCSIIIIFKLYSAKRIKTQEEKKNKKNGHFFRTLNSLKSDASSINFTTHISKTRKERRSMSKQMQVTSILLTTNFLFFSLVSPLLVMNILNMLREDTLRTTIAYFLCYANHGY